MNALPADVPPGSYAYDAPGRPTSMAPRTRLGARHPSADLECHKAINLASFLPSNIGITAGRAACSRLGTAYSPQPR